MKRKVAGEHNSDLCILNHATPADIRLDPYPHILIHDALPQRTYDALAASFPSFEYIAGEEAAANNKACLLGAADTADDPAVAGIWREFIDYHLSQAFFDRFVGLWGETIQRVHPDLEENFDKPLAQFEVGARASGKGEAAHNRQPDIVLDCVFGVNTPVRKPTPVRGPHIDSPFKLFSSLLYFRDPDDASQGGEHEMYRVGRRIYPKRKLKKIPARYVDLVARIPYRANTLLFWLNTAESIHAVSPRGITRVPRRYMAVMGECYGGKAADGFFAHHPQWQSMGGRLRSWLNV